MAFLRLLLLASIALFGAGPGARADDYPDKPVKMVVPFPAGGSIDIVARLVGQELAKTLGQSVVVDNRSGAGGSIGTDAVAKAAPDGYTLLMGSASSLAANRALYSKLPYDPEKDFSAISLVALQPNVLLVHPSVPAKTVAELIAYAKANPGELNYASAGAGTSQHLAAELFRSKTGVDIVHVPYRGGAPALIDLMAGQVQLMFETIPTAIQPVQSGQLRALAVTTVKRSSMLPDLPTIEEAGVAGYVARGWVGLVAPAGTPAPIIEKLGRATQVIVRKPEITRRLTELGLEVAASSPAEFGDFIRTEVAAFKEVVAAAKISLD
jgi:tripartite-type tricarboxylate transporter receptor subunit TctC